MTAPRRFTKSGHATGDRRTACILFGATRAWLHAMKMNEGKDVVLVRHGETEWSRARRHTGRTDVPLTDAGRRQADALAKMLTGFAFARVLCSPLQRAVETCTRAGLFDRAEICDDAVEWDYGVYEGRHTSDIREEIPGWTVWTNQIIGGESVIEVGVRADRVISAALAVDGDVAIFAHAHFLRILAARWLDLDAVRGSNLVLDTASLSILAFEREQRVIGRWNEPCPLRETDATR